MSTVKTVARVVMLVIFKTRGSTSNVFISYVTRPFPLSPFPSTSAWSFCFSPSFLWGWVCERRDKEYYLTTARSIAYQSFKRKKKTFMIYVLRHRRCYVAFQWTFNTLQTPNSVVDQERVWGAYQLQICIWHGAFESYSKSGGSSIFQWTKIMSLYNHQQFSFSLFRILWVHQLHLRQDTVEHIQVYRAAKDFDCKITFFW